MELHDLERLLDAKLEPLHHSIDRLERNYEKVVDIMSQLARHGEIFKFLQETLSKYEIAQDGLYKRMRNLEDKQGDKLWDLVKIGITVVVAIILTLLGMKNFG